MARVVKESHSNIYLPPTRLSKNGMNHTCLGFPAKNWSSITYPGGMKGWVGLRFTTVSKQSAQERFSPCGFRGLE